MRKPDLSLILPCYNEGPTFVSSTEKIIKSLKGVNWEIIFVEDKSDDDTRLKVESLVKNLGRTKAIYHSKNMGRGKSVADGIRASRANICGYVDVDCEISPSYINLFVKEIRSGSDLVVGKRYYEKGWKSMHRVIASLLYSSLVKWILKLPIDDTEAGYKFFNKSMINKIIKKVEDPGWFWDTEICARAYAAGLNISQVPVLFIRRPEKKSTVKIIPDSFAYIKMLIRFRFRNKKY